MRLERDKISRFRLTLTKHHGTKSEEDADYGKRVVLHGRVSSGNVHSIHTTKNCYCLDQEVSYGNVHLLVA